MKFAKAVVAGVGAIISVLTAALADDVFNASEIGTIIAVLIEQGVLVWAVWRIPNG